MHQRSDKNASNWPVEIALFLQDFIRKFSAKVAACIKKLSWKKTKKKNT